MKVTQRYMVRGLEHEFMFDQEYVEDVACMDEVDRAIINELHYAGPYGILPRDVASEKVGKGWALTTFLREAWDSTQQKPLINI